MYTPSSFKETDPNILFELIEKYNFGILFSQHEELAEATHLPFIVDRERGILIAHFAKANKHWRRIHSEKEVLVVFQGPHTYISPSWYKNRNTVPTWNYATVHVYGKIRIVEDPKILAQMVTRLTHFHENQVDTDWDLSEGHSVFEKELKAIVGFELEITSMEGKFKFNQNRSEEDQQSVVDHLREEDAPGVKEIMQKNLKKK